MEIKIYAEGSGFKETSDLRSVIDILDGHSAGFNFCLKKSFLIHKIGPDIPVPVIDLIDAKPGSINIRLITEIAAAIAPLAPDLFGYAWTLYKAGFDLVELAVKFFKRERKTLSISVADSPGASVSLVAADRVVVTSDVLEAAVKSHRDFKKIASVVKSGKADQVVIETDEPETHIPIRFYPSNKDDFEVQSYFELENIPVEIQCTIIRFHKKTMNGSLEIIEDESRQTYNFTIDQNLYADCIRAFGADIITATVLRKFEKNALGESKIKSFHLIGIVQ